MAQALLNKGCHTLLPTPPLINDNTSMHLSLVVFERKLNRGSGTRRNGKDPGNNWKLYRSTGKSQCLVPLRLRKKPEQGQQSIASTKKHREPITICKTGVGYESTIACHQGYISQTGQCINQKATEPKPVVITKLHHLSSPCSYRSATAAFHVRMCAHFLSKKHNPAKKHYQSG